MLRALREAGRRAWADKDQLGHVMGASMRAGVATSAVFVALVSRRYASSANCMLELREAATLRKPIVSCLVEPDAAW